MNENIQNEINENMLNGTIQNEINENMLNGIIDLDDKDGVYINNVVIKDKDLYDILSIKNGLERVEIFNQIVRNGIIGLMAVKGFTISERVEKRFADMLRDNVDKLKIDFKDLLNSDYSTMNDAINLLRDNLDNIKIDINLSNPDSSLSKLKEYIDSLKDLINSDSITKKEDISKIYEIVKKEMDNLTKEIAEIKGWKEGRKEIYDKSTEKGSDFEDIVHYSLNKITANNFDNVNRISRTYGAIGTKGDFQIEIYGINKKILIEAKTEKVDINRANKYLDECIVNWPSTDFCILVYKDDPNVMLNGIRFEKDNRILCGFGEDGELLSTAYRIARILLVNDHRHTSEMTRKEKEYRGIISGISTFGINRIEIKNDVIEVIRYINEITKVRQTLKKSYDEFSTSFDRSIIGIDEFKRNLGNKLYRLEKKLGTENLHKEDTEIKNIKDTEIKDTEIKDTEIKNIKDTEIKDIRYNDDVDNVENIENQEDIQEIQIPVKGDGAGW